MSSSGGTTCAPALRDAGFKKCCMQTDNNDGVDRHYYYR